MRWIPIISRYRIVSNHIGYDRFNQSDPIVSDVLIRSKLGESGKRIYKRNAINHRITSERILPDSIVELDRFSFLPDRFRSFLLHLGYYKQFEQFLYERANCINEEATKIHGKKSRNLKRGSTGKDYRTMKNKVLYNISSYQLTQLEERT